MNTPFKKIIALAFVLMLVVTAVGLAMSEPSDGDAGKYLRGAEVTKTFNNLDGGTLTVTFQRMSTESVIEVKITSTDGKSVYVDEKDVKIPAISGSDREFKKGFSFKLGGSGAVKIIALENGVETGFINTTIEVEQSIWTNPLVWVAVVIAIIAIAILAFMRYRHVTDAKKDNPKEKIFTKMAEEKKKKKQS